MFTQKLSMDCTKEQYEKYLKDELLKIGYREVCACGWEDNPYLFNNFLGEVGQVGNGGDKNEYGRTYLGKFNAPLFLALSAKTDSINGSYGEWWVCTCDSFSFTSGKLYKQVDYSCSSPDFIDDNGSKNGIWWANLSRSFRKAKVSELMAKFGEQTNKGKIEFELTLDTKALDEQIEKLAMSIQMTEQLIKLEGELRKAFDTKEEPVSKEPIIGEMAILWDDKKTRACCRLLNSVLEDGSFMDNFSAHWRNAILFESAEQYKSFINA